MTKPYPNAEAKCLICGKDLTDRDAYFHLARNHESFRGSVQWFVTIEQAYQVEMNLTAERIASCEPSSPA